MDRAEAEAIYDAGRGVVVSTLLELSGVVEQMAGQVATLTARVEELERRLAKNSRNSSKPPSSDPPWTPKAQPKKPSGRKPGGQDGHEGRHRLLYEADRVEPVWPAACGCCGRNLPQQPEGAPRVHQVAELPPIAVEIVEYQLNSVACPSCTQVTCAQLPDGVSRSAFGPRLHALVGTLSADARVSRRNIHVLLTRALACPVSLGAVDAMLSRLGTALQAPYEQALDFVRRSPTACVDETGWKIDGEQSWVWGAFTDQVGVMMIDPERSADACDRLLGDFDGIVSCDRYAVYRSYDRQLCWAHLDRNLSELALFPEPTRSTAHDLKRCCDDVFAAWRDYADTHQDRNKLQRRIGTIRRRMRKLLEAAADNGRDKKARRFCRNVLRDFDDYWTFARAPGLEPTNNDAERGLRRAVITRKLTAGNRTTRGSQTTERLLTAAETCRRQGRSLYDYLADAASAAARREPAPSLLPA